MIKKIILLFMISTIWHINAQEMRIWTNGELQYIKDTIYDLPITPPDSNMRYIEFTDFVLNVTVRSVKENFEDSIADYRRSRWSMIPVKMAEIEEPKIYYRFTMEVGDSLGGLNLETCTYEKHLVDVPSDIDVASVRNLLFPSDMNIPIGIPCFLWVSAVFKDVYYVIEVVNRNTVFVNRFSDYAGSICPNLQNYCPRK